MTPKDKQSAVAAGLILAFVAVSLILMPRIVIGISELTSPFVGAAIALIFVLLPFIILWLRSRQQKREAAAAKANENV
jgi:predicted tellurium resistance membrane protein TerC